MRRSIKFGIFGLGRGGSFYSSILSNDGDIVAVCDLSQEKLDGAKKALGNSVATYQSFDDFINHEGLEAIFLCNYFTSTPLTQYAPLSAGFTFSASAQATLRWQTASPSFARRKRALPSL